MTERTSTCEQAILGCAYRLHPIDRGSTEPRHRCKSDSHNSQQSNERSAAVVLDVMAHRGRFTAPALAAAFTDVGGELRRQFTQRYYAIISERRGGELTARN